MRDTNDSTTPFMVPTHPDYITDDNWFSLVNSLMRAQFRYTAACLESNVERWGEDFISDDGTDYTTTALDAASDLMGLRYDGDRETLVHWLFGTPESLDLELPVFNLPVHPGAVTTQTVRDIDSAGGLCNELVDFIHAVWD